MKTGTAVAIPLAIGAAGCFAAANVMQTASVRRQPRSDSVELGLVVRLIRQPLWLAGLVASVVGFALEAVALALAPVVLVQPLIVAELLFALPLAARSAGTRMGRREWAGAILVAAGLAVFVIAIRPDNPTFYTKPMKWVLLACATSLVVAVVITLAQRSRGVTRTSLMALAAAICLGLLSVLTKTADHDFATHGVGALMTWQPWSVAGAGLIGLSLAQNSFGAGPLAVSLPLIDVGEPIVASIISIVVFHEQLGSLSDLAFAGLVLSALVVVAGVVVLDRSPLVQAAQRDLAVDTLTPNA